MSRCPKSKRGHSWGGRDAILEARRDDPSRRTCAACGASGRINNQGVTVEEKTSGPA